MMPKRGIWQHTRKMKRVIAVHNTFSLKEEVGVNQE